MDDGEKNSGEEEEGEEEEDWALPPDGLSFNPSAHTVTDNEDQYQPYLRSKLGHSRTVIHIDLDCFYAQVEMLRNPALRDQPLGIQQKNILVTTNYVARSRGISKLSYIREAVVKCPDLVIVNGEDLTNYREMSAKVTEVLEEFCPSVERLGFDENFMDVSSIVESRLASGRAQMVALATHQGHSYGHNQNTVEPPWCRCGCRERLTIGAQVAMEMREALRSRLGLTSCAGVATNKLLAKLVGGQHKPNDQTVLYSEWTGHFMRSFTKLRQIPGIGHSSGKKLAAIGVASLDDLRTTPVSTLARQFGQQQAETMLRLAHGVDDTAVISKGLPQSLSDEDSFKKLGTLPAAKQSMSGLIQNLIKRLRADGRDPHTIRLTARKYNPGTWHRESRQTSLPDNLFHKLDDATLLTRLLDIALGLLQKLINTSQPFHLTLINICFTNFRSKVTKGSLESFFSKPAQRAEREGQGKTSGDGQQPDDGPGKRDGHVNRADNSNSVQFDDHSVVQDGKFNARNAQDPGVNRSSAPNMELKAKQAVEDHKAHHGRQLSRETEKYTQSHVSSERGFHQESSFFKKLSNSPSNAVASAVGQRSKVHQRPEFSPLNDSTSEEIQESVCRKENNQVTTTSWTLDACPKSVRKRCLENRSETCTSQSSPDVDVDVAASRVDSLNEGFEKDMEGLKDATDFDIPPDVDRSVFDALPTNMKEELVNEWRRTKRRKLEESQQRSPLASASASSSSTARVLSHTSKSLSARKQSQATKKKNTITRYFKH